MATTFLSGRWKYCALGFSGISGGTLVALFLCVILHPSLTTRIILTAIGLPIIMVLTLLPLIHFQRAALRFATSVTGAFGMVLSIALLSHILAWANVWERYWESDSLSWGTSKEKGLSAAFCLFLCTGMASDWLLRRMFGECLDEKWDHHLASFATNFPNRVGTFRPLHSFWDRLFGAQKITHQKTILPNEMAFLRDDDMKVVSSPDIQFPFNLRNPDPHITKPATHITAAFEFQNLPACLKKGSPRFQARRGRRREAVKFDYMYSSDSDSEDLEGNHVRPWLNQKPVSASVGSQRALNSGRNEKKVTAQIKNGPGEGDISGYSDFEDVTENKQGWGSLDQDWSPAFLRKHQYASATSSGSQTSPSMSSVLPSLGVIPATPSLIKALNRVAVAQQAAYGSDARQPCLSPSMSTEPSTHGLPKILRKGEERKEPQWDEFWKDVRDKARD